MSSQLISTVLLILLFISCGFQKTKEKKVEDDTDTTAATGDESSSSVSSVASSSNSASNNIPTVNQPVVGAPNMVEVKINFVDQRTSGFNLVAGGESITPWQITIINCASGYSPVWTQADAGSFFLYRGDENCLAQLDTFTMDALAWQKVGGGGCTTTAICNYEDTPGATQLVQVSISSLLTTNIGAGAATTETLTVSVVEIEAGVLGDLTAGAEIYDASTTLTVAGARAPKVAWGTTPTTLDDIDATGIATLTFKIECDNNVVETGGQLTWTCDGQELSDYKIVLINDVYAGAPTYDEAVAEIAGGTPVATAIDASHIYGITGGADPLAAIPKGGFVISLPSEQATIYDNPNMLLILQYDEASGGTAKTIRYWNVDITQLAE